MAERKINDYYGAHYHIAASDIHQAQAHLDRARHTAQRINAGAQFQLNSEIAPPEQLIAEVRANH
jgi:hypothetical protein